MTNHGCLHNGVLTKVAIVDDEPLARRKLFDLLSGYEFLKVVGEANSVESATALVNEQKPDVVFLDIQMSDGSGFDVLTNISVSPTVIFTTAYDSYAIAAFELGAIDYLLKPFGKKRFEKAIQRILGQNSIDVPSIQQFDFAKAACSSSRLEYLYVRDTGKIVRIEIREIEYFKGERDYVQIISAGKSYLISVRLKNIESRLAANEFIRLHRSYIANLRFITEAYPLENGRYKVRMNCGKEIEASRKGASLLRTHLRESRELG